MIDRSNEIFTKVKQAVGEQCKSFTQSRNETPPSFPCIAVIQLPSPEVNKSRTLNNFKQRAIQCNIEIRVFTTGNGKLQKAKDIMNLACDELCSIGFNQTYGPNEIENYADTNICTYITRHTRLIAEGDKLERL